MDSTFWHARWQQGRTGFHNQRPLPLLIEHWPALDLPRGSRVFVPLCGKSLDLLWLVQQGYRVLGVELSPLAVQQFFAEHGLVPHITDSPLGRHYCAEGVELICGDVFDLDAATLADCAAVYDRAALIALPPALRRRYVREVYARLPSTCCALLITMEYPQWQKDGPPFSVRDSEVHALFGDAWATDLLQRQSILAQEPGFAAAGVTALDSVVYRLTRTSAGGA